MILAAVKVNFWLGFLAATTMILGAAYTLWMYKRVIFGPVANERVQALSDVNRREFWLLGSVALLVLWMGVYPKPFIDVMHVIGRRPAGARRPQQAMTGRPRRC